MRLGRHGQLIPVKGFSRRKAALPPGQTGWGSHDGLVVVSALETAHLPGTHPPVEGPQWLVSVSRENGGNEDARCRATDDDVRRVVECFAMPAFDEDNHHPGIARHLWCPVDPAYQLVCECKLTEVTITDEVNGYQWTTEEDSCRGCAYELMFKVPCPLHSRQGSPS